jgi:hypothetical protein
MEPIPLDFHMKQSFTLQNVLNSILVASFVFCGLSTTGRAENKTNSLFDQINIWRASNDVLAIMEALPDIEKLWPNQPEEYLKCMTVVAPCLSYASATNKQSADAMLVVFTNLMKTNYPEDLGMAARCVELQCAAIESSFNSETLRQNKACLLAYAKFLGQIRSLRIPNYSMRGSGTPPGAREIFMREHVPPSYDRLTNDADRQAYTQLVAENAKAQLMDNYQNILLTADNGTKFMLLSYCSYFSASNPTNVDFVREIVQDAHLSEAERQQLEKK